MLFSSSCDSFWMVLYQTVAITNSSVPYNTSWMPKKNCMAANCRASCMHAPVILTMVGKIATGSDFLAPFRLQVFCFKEQILVKNYIRESVNSCLGVAHQRGGVAYVKCARLLNNWTIFLHSCEGLSGVFVFLQCPTVLPFSIKLQ